VPEKQVPALSSATRPIRSRTQETQPSAQAYTQQQRRRFTSAVPDPRSHGMSTPADNAAPAYNLVTNPVWQPQAMPLQGMSEARPLAPQPYFLQRQYQQPGEPSNLTAPFAQQGSKRPRLTADSDVAHPAGAAPASAVPPYAAAAAKHEQQQQQQQQQPDLQQQVQVSPAAAQSRVDQLCQLAEAFPDGSSYHESLATNAQGLPVATCVPPAQTGNMHRMAAVWQPDASLAPLAAELAAQAAATVAAPSRHMSPQQEVQQLAQSAYG
jgi:hypothetical protein